MFTAAFSMKNIISATQRLAQEHEQMQNAATEELELQYMPEVNPESPSQRVLVLSQTTPGAAEEYDPEIKVTRTSASASAKCPGRLTISLVCTNPRGETVRATIASFATRDNAPIYLKLVSRNHPPNPIRPMPVAEWLYFRVGGAQAAAWREDEIGVTCHFMAVR